MFYTSFTEFMCNKKDMFSRLIMHVEQNFVVANNLHYLWETLRFSGNKIKWSEGKVMKVICYIGK